MTPRPPQTPEGVADDLEPPPSAQELAEAQRLARALEGQEEHPLAPFAEALRAAHAPAPLDPARNEELIVQALADAQRGGQVLSFRTRRWAWVGLLAAAACLALVLGRSLRRPVPVALTASRSTQELFTEQFPKQGGHSARVDRISEARSRELRENRFARWGVR